jgi:hypothetical protein
MAGVSVGATGFNASARVRQCAWNGSVFCAVSGNVNDRFVQVSTDGIIWASHSRPNASAAYGIAWNGSLFCTSRGEVSPDGVTWEQRTIPINTTGPVIMGAIGNLFIATLRTLVNIIYTSTDAITWTERTLPAADLYDYYDWINIKQGNGTAVMMAGYPGVWGSIFAVSSDGTAWEKKRPTYSIYYESSLAYGNARYVAVGGTRFTGPPLADEYYITEVSTDEGQTWTTHDLSTVPNYDPNLSLIVPHPNGIYAVGFARDKFYGISYGYYPELLQNNGWHLLSSLDGVTWAYVADISTLDIEYDTTLTFPIVVNNDNCIIFHSTIGNKTLVYTLDPVEPVVTSGWWTGLQKCTQTYS